MIVRDKSTTPSGFTLKLRKHIRSKRLEDVRQLGYDRVCRTIVAFFVANFVCKLFADWGCCVLFLKILIVLMSIFLDESCVLYVY